jgi:hypothetical protein
MALGVTKSPDEAGPRAGQNAWLNLLGEKIKRE